MTRVTHSGKTAVRPRFASGHGPTATSHFWSASSAIRQQLSSSAAPNRRRSCASATSATWPSTTPRQTACSRSLQVPRSRPPAGSVTGSPSGRARPCGRSAGTCCPSSRGAEWRRQRLGWRWNAPATPAVQLGLQRRVPQARVLASRRDRGRVPARSHHARQRLVPGP